MVLQLPARPHDNRHRSCLGDEIPDYSGDETQSGAAASDTSKSEIPSHTLAEETHSGAAASDEDWQAGGATSDGGDETVSVRPAPVSMRAPRLWSDLDDCPLTPNAVRLQAVRSRYFPKSAYRLVDDAHANCEADTAEKPGSLAGDDFEHLLRKKRRQWELEKLEHDRRFRHFKQVVPKGAEKVPYFISRIGPLAHVEQVHWSSHEGASQAEGVAPTEQPALIEDSAAAGVDDDAGRSGGSSSGADAAPLQHAVRPCAPSPSDAASVSSGGGPPLSAASRDADPGAQEAHGIKDASAQSCRGLSAPAPPLCSAVDLLRPGADPRNQISGKSTPSQFSLLVEPTAPEGALMVAIAPEEEDPSSMPWLSMRPSPSAPAALPSVAFDGSSWSSTAGGAMEASISEPAAYLEGREEKPWVWETSARSRNDGFTGKVVLFGGSACEHLFVAAPRANSLAGPAAAVTLRTPLHQMFSL